jgi:alpha-mannosidase
MDKVFSQPHIFVASTPKDIQIPFHQPGLSMLKASLPENVMIVTFSASNAGSTFLVRLAHQYGIDEDHLYSSPAHVDLQDLFPNHHIASITEMTLSANQVRADWEKRRLRWSGNKEEASIDDSTTVVVLKPLEIRTFEISVISSKSK